MKTLRLLTAYGGGLWASKDGEYGCAGEQEVTAAVDGGDLQSWRGAMKSKNARFLA